MSEMVERVARTLCGEDDIVGDWRAYVDQARAAILAMREPTEGMTAAGQKVNNLCEEPGHFEFLSRDEIDGIWQAMVDEGLKS